MTSPANNTQVYQHVIGANYSKLMGELDTLEREGQIPSTSTIGQTTERTDKTSRTLDDIKAKVTISPHLKEKEITTRITALYETFVGQRSLITGKAHKTLNEIEPYKKSVEQAQAAIEILEAYSGPQPEHKIAVESAQALLKARKEGIKEPNRLLGMYKQTNDHIDKELIPRIEALAKKHGILLVEEKEEWNVRTLMGAAAGFIITAGVAYTAGTYGK